MEKERFLKLLFHPNMYKIEQKGYRDTQRSPYTRPILDPIRPKKQKGCPTCPKAAILRLCIIYQGKGMLSTTSKPEVRPASLKHDQLA